MRVPRTDTSSARTNAPTPDFDTRTMSSPMASNIKRPYGFVKWNRAEDLRGPEGGTAWADPGRRSQLFCDVRVRGSDGGPPRGGHRPLERRDLQLLPLQGGSLRRARRGGQRPHVAALPAGWARSSRRGRPRTRSGLDLGQPGAPATSADGRELPPPHRGALRGDHPREPRPARGVTAQRGASRRSRTEGPRSVPQRRPERACAVEGV